MQRKNPGLTCCVIMFFACIFLCCSSAFSQQRQSARIRALGGVAVSGIVPDYLTDLWLNPAYAQYADGLSIEYGHRQVPTSREVPFLALNTTGSITNIVYPVMPTPYSTTNSNELMVYGLGWMDWKIALYGEWRFKKDENKRSYISQRSWSAGRTVSYRNLPSLSDFDFWNIDVTAARHLWNEYVAGVRFGGNGFYYNSYSHRKERVDEYRYINDFNDEYIYRTNSSDNHSTETERWLSAYLQAGLVHEEGGERTDELTLLVSRSPICQRRHTYYQAIDRTYEEDSDIDSYEYDYTEWRDIIDGVLWEFELQGRRVTPSKTRIFMGARFGTAAYDSDWRALLVDYEWESQTYSSNDGLLLGKGCSKEVSLFTKVGKTYTIHRMIDLTLGLRGSFSRSWASEDASSEYAALFEKPFKREESSSDERLDFKYEVIDLSLMCPVAIELRAAGFFSYFACFAPHLVWKRSSSHCELPTFMEHMGVPDLYFSGAKPYRSDSPAVSDRYVLPWKEIDLYTQYSATVGFSLHYNDVLSVDLYTQSYVIPNSIESTILDIRYRF